MVSKPPCGAAEQQPGSCCRCAISHHHSHHTLQDPEIRVQSCSKCIWFARMRLCTSGEARTTLRVAKTKATRLGCVCAHGMGQALSAARRCWFSCSVTQFILVVRQWLGEGVAGQPGARKGERGGAVGWRQVAELVGRRREERRDDRAQGDG